MATAGPNESDTCRDFVMPAIRAAGWPENSIKEQYRISADIKGRYLPHKSNRKRKADYVLFLTPDLPMVAIEAKRLWAECHGVPTPEEAWLL